MFLEHFRNVFRSVDSDGNGVISDGASGSCCHSFAFAVLFAEASASAFMHSRGTVVCRWLVFSVEFLRLVRELGIPGSEADLLARADPFSNSHISFSDCVHVLSNELGKIMAG
jgi:hypothetical protein